MKINRTKAIILKRTNYGEADKILQLLTPDGKKSAIAKGVRREKSRLSPGLELFAICDVVLGESKGSLQTITSARLIKFYNHIILDYDRMQFAYFVTKLVSNASEMIDEIEWYELLAEIMEALDNNAIRLDLIQTWFYLRYSALMGYELSLWYDTAGDKLSPDNKYRYDELERGLAISVDGVLSSDHIKLLRLVATRSINVVSQVGGIDSIIVECLSVAHQHASI